MAGSSFSSLSSFIDSQAKYDVFLSFRGEDTRFGFTSYLHAALRRKNIETFIDDEKIETGDELSPTLLKAIERSKITIVIFSKNYASSKWCLDELEKIIECKNRKKQIVIPIFYDVDPSHIRWQKGTYKDSFAKHEESFRDIPLKVQNWRKALYEAANFSGWHSSNVRPENELVEKIVEDVLQKLNHISKHIPKEFVGIQQISFVESLLCIGLADVRLIGIWGMGGIGKTTIAEALFTRLSSKFEGCCFVSNVREEWKNHRENDLRDKLLAEISGEKDLHIGTPSISLSFLRERLRRRKLLVVLDDVSSSEQIEYLIGNKDLFGLGSRIIVTTRNKDVFNMGVDGIYKVKELNFYDALKLFCLKTFRQDHPLMKYRDLSERVINYAKGIPLALKVLGSFLRSKTPKEWESTLQKLRKFPCQDIFNVLKLSYEGLDREVQNIFLDIACFLKGEKRCFIKTLLDGCGYSSDIGMRILEDNSLITVSKCHEVEMHDLIQEMGWEIVCQESPKKPGTRSRLWDPEDIYPVLKYNTGTDAVEGIVLDMSQIKDVQIRPQAFAQMYKLRILKFYKPSYDKTCNVHIPKCLDILPDELSYFCWHCFPLKMLPQSFCAEKLVQLDLRHSLVERLWGGVQDLVNLKSLYLSGCKQLVELPDFSEASKLEEVHLDYCTSLCNLPSSIFSSKYLFALNLRCCGELQCIQSDMGSISLRWLNLSGCSKLAEFSVVSETLEYLNLEGTAIEKLSSSVGRLKNLSSFQFSGCRRLMNLPKNFYNIGLNTSIEALNCPNLEILPPVSDASGSVKSLVLDGCSDLSKLPDNLGQLSTLNRLSLRGSNIETLPVSIKHISQLRALDVSDCRRLQSLPDLPFFLQDLNASGCISLERVSSSRVAVMLNSFGWSNKRSLLKNIQEDEEKSVRHRDYLTKFDFYNCRKLDQDALERIMAEAVTTIQHAAYLSVIEARYDPYCGLNHVSEDSDLVKFEYTSRRVYACFPGSEVPKWFRYKATESFTITVTIPSYWSSKFMRFGFAFCLVLAQPQPNKMGNNKHGFFVGCKCFMDQKYDRSYIMKSSSNDAESDQVWLWYDNLSIRIHEEGCYTNVSFEFFVRGHNSRLVLKQCGVQPLYTPDDIDIGQSSNRQEGNKRRESFESKFYESEIRKLGVYGPIISAEHLELDGYSAKSLPVDFFAVANLLVEVLSLRDSKIESLPASIKHLSRLKRLYLNNCERLQFIPQLPPSIEYVDASNCISLETVCFPTSEPIMKNRAYLFENCRKLDAHTIDTFLRHAHLMMKQLAYYREPDFHGFQLCLPGHKVPDWFTYRTMQAVMNIELASLSDLLGFIFCAVISHVPQVEGYSSYLELDCYMENGESIGRMDGPSIVSTNSDHDYFWNEIPTPLQKLRRIVSYIKHDGSTRIIEDDTGIEELGFYPIYASVPRHKRKREEELEVGCGNGELRRERNPNLFA